MLTPVFTPFPELATQRFLLRKLVYEDANEVFFLRSDGDVLRFLGKEPITTVAEAEEFIGKVNKSLSENENIMWAITLKQNPGVVIGTICLWNFRNEHYRAEIGYVLHPSHWGKGIMKEAIGCVVDYGFSKLGLHSIEALLSPENIASSAVLEHNGFIKEGHLKENVFFNGKFGDTAIYSRLK